MDRDRRERRLRHHYASRSPRRRRSPPPPPADRLRRPYRSRSPSPDYRRSPHRQYSRMERDREHYSGALERYRRSPSSGPRREPERLRDDRRRHHSRSEEHSSVEDRRRRRSEDRSSGERSRRSRRLRRRRKRARHESPSVAAPPSPAAGGGGRPAAGLVSDDEADNATGFRKGMARPKEGSVGSVHDDSTGHFTGPPGSVIDDRFRVVRQVGMGTFGRVLECLDLTRPRRSRGRRRDHDDEGPRVAIKIVRKIKRYYESAQIEAKIVDALNRRGGRGTSHCAVMFDAFTWNQHFCMVFECLGPSLYDFLKRHRYQPFPYFCIRDFSQQLLETLDFLHGFGLIHTDLKPENIILMNHRETTHRGRRQSFQIPESTRIKVIDFGSATYEDEKKSKIVNTRQYRAPEVILGIGWNKAVDLWSIGCILMELYTGDLLFPTHDNIEHLAQMEKVIGPFPRRVLREARKSDIASKAFDRTGKHREGGVLSEDSAAYVSGMQPLENIIRREDDRLLQLMRRLLVIDPQDRGSAYECLRYRL